MSTANTPSEELTYAAFKKEKLIAEGDLKKVILKTKRELMRSPESAILIFSNETGKTMDFNFQGSENEVLSRLEVFLEPKIEIDPKEKKVGRPSLGVISREVSLLPKHWEWLACQSGGASAEIRRLVEKAMKQTQAASTVKMAQEKTFRFLNTIAGNFPNFEEAIRSLYRRDLNAFEQIIKFWPVDIKDHALHLSKHAW